MKVLLCKSKNGGIYPAYEFDRDNLRKIKAGDFFTADVTRPRNLLHHRKFFAMLNLCMENQEIYKHLEDLRRDVTIEAGYFYHRTTFLGEVVREPKSISFAKMDDYEFQDFYSKCVNVIITHFHFDREAFVNEIEQYFI